MMIVVGRAKRKIEDRFEGPLALDSIEGTRKASSSFKAPAPQLHTFKCTVPCRKMYIHSSLSTICQAIASVVADGVSS